MHHHLPSKFGRSLVTLFISLMLLFVFGTPALAQAELASTAMLSPTIASAPTTINRPMATSNPSEMGEATAISSPTVVESPTVTNTPTTTITATKCITETAAVTKTDTTKKTDTVEKTEPKDLRWLVGMTLAFSALVLGSILWYIYRVQMKFYDMTAQLSRASIAMRTSVIRTFTPKGGAAKLSGEGNNDETPQHKLTLEGPDTITVGTQSEEFTATLDPDDESKINWSITPAEDAAVRPTTGKHVKVVAFKAGMYKLKATIKDSTPEISAEKDITVGVASEGYAVDLPFVGSGHGTLAIAIVVLTALMVLGFAEVLSGEGIIGVLSGLTGYIFGVKTGEAGKDDKKKSS